MTGILPVDITTEVKTNFINYAMNVIVDRALPDVRDGLKPVQRRIMYAMLQEGLASNTKHAKSASVVGEVMKKYHPHGDSSIYDAMVRLGQWWNIRYSMVDPQGNYVGERGSETSEELVVRDLDLDLIRKVRNDWQFYRDRRPESYTAITAP